MYILEARDKRRPEHYEWTTVGYVNSWYRAVYETLIAKIWFYDANHRFRKV